MHKSDIEDKVKGLMQSSKLNDRLLSFDYCYNYFMCSSSLSDDIEKSCLVLGYYLASWGMFRGSSFISKRSIKHFEPTINYISSLDKAIWKIDVDTYNEKNIETVIEIYNKIKQLIIPSNHSDLVLISKVLLGVFGFSPAFDRNFCNSFKTIYKGKCGFTRFNSKSLSCIKSFYDSNKETIDGLSSTIYTRDFKTGEKTKISYTKAKIIDMYGFISK